VVLLLFQEVKYILILTSISETILLFRNWSQISYGYWITTKCCPGPNTEDLKLKL